MCGISPYQIVFDGNAASEEIAGLPSGAYPLEVIDANNCIWDTLLMITEPTALTDSVVISDYNGYGVSCTDAVDGVVEIYALGGTAPYSYSWQGYPDEDNILSNLPADTYYTSITDDNGCVYPDSIVVTQPIELALTNLEPIDPTCIDGTNGSVVVGMTGGVAPYQYDTINFSSTLELTGFPQGSYILNIFDANGCEYVQSFELEEQFSTFNLVIDSVDC